MIIVIIENSLIALGLKVLLSIGIIGNLLLSCSCEKCFLISFCSALSCHLSNDQERLRQTISWGFYRVLYWNPSISSLSNLFWARTPRLYLVPRASQPSWWYIKGWIVPLQCQRPPLALTSYVGTPRASTLLHHSRPLGPHQTRSASGDHWQWSNF